MKGVSSLVVAGFATSVLANSATADIDAASAPIKKPDQWQGWYVGGSIGKSWGNSEIRYAHTGDSESLYGVNLGLGAFSADDTLSPQSGIAGLVIGYNAQSSGVVFGLEGDFSYRNGGHRKRLLPGFLTSSETLSVTTDTKQIATLRGRVGHLMGRKWLAYTTGGLAYGRSRQSVVQSLNLKPAFNFQTQNVFSDESTNIGWVVGAGIEARVYDGWTIGAEYLFSDSGRHSVVAAPSTGDPELFGNIFPASRVSTRDTSHIARVTIKYSFGQ